MYLASRTNAFIGSPDAIANRKGSDCAATGDTITVNSPSKLLQAQL